MPGPFVVLALFARMRITMEKVPYVPGFPCPGFPALRVISKVQSHGNFFDELRKTAAPRKNNRIIQL
jgi:hypothetical protein